MNLLKSRFVGDGQSSARERHRAFSGPVASPVTHQEPLEMQPTSAASKNHSSTTSSQKNLGKRPTREPFHTGKSIHTPDAITAPFPAQLDMLEGIHTPEAVHIPGGLHTSSGLSAAAESAAESVVLLSVDDGAWASGVVLSAEGLILTNAHLIEPWRFAAKPKVHGSKMQQRVRFGEGVSETDERVKMTKRSGGADEEMVRKTGEQFWEGRETSRAVSERVRQRGTIGLETKWFEGEAVSREASRSTSAAAGFAGAQSAAGPSSSGGASKSVGADPLLPAERGGNSGGFEMRSDDRSDQRSAYWDWIGGAARRNPATCLEQSEPASEDSFSALGTFAGRLGSPAGVRDSTHYFDHFLGTENLHKSPYENAKHAARLDRESTSTQQSPQPHLRVEPLFAPPLSLRETASNPPRYYRPVKVRLSDRGGAATWQSARVVFVSQGPFDAAVLQLLNAPTGLRPIVPAERAPPAGATAVVVGHGLFGPMSGEFDFFSVQKAAVELFLSLSF